MWTSVGLLLWKVASKWVFQLTIKEATTVLIAGITFGTLVGQFGFLKIAKKNILRISLLPEKISIFAFQELKSYILIAFMISLGLFLRHTSFVPRIYLACLYISIGTALMRASIQYYIAHKVS